MHDTPMAGLPASPSLLDYHGANAGKGRFAYTMRTRL
jgi:hypothetical protein